jgi:hypothetical protein
VRVVYQGTSALDQVLQADLSKGTPPDVVVLPRPGDLQGYAATVWFPWAACSPAPTAGTARNGSG